VLLNLEIAAWSVPPVRTRGLGCLDGEHEDRRFDETSGAHQRERSPRGLQDVPPHGERSSANEELRPRQEAGDSRALQSRLRQDRMDDLSMSH
jgi:hypothetical protein